MPEAQSSIPICLIAQGPKPGVGHGRLVVPGHKVYSKKEPLPAFTQGHQHTASSIPVYLTGPIPVSSTSPAYTSGHQHTASSIPVYLTGPILVGSSVDAFIEGQDSGVSSQDAYTQGKANILESQAAFLAGGLTTGGVIAYEDGQAFCKQWAVTAGSQTFSFDCDTVTNGLMVVAIDLNNGAPGDCYVTSVTYNSQPLTFIDNVQPVFTDLSLWYLKAPPSGAHDLVISISSDTTPWAIVCHVAVYSGVDQNTPIGTPVKDLDWSTQDLDTTEIVSAPGELVIAVSAGHDFSKSVYISDAGQFVRFLNQSGDETGGGDNSAVQTFDEEPGAASVYCGWTLTSAGDVGYVAFPLKPSSPSLSAYLYGQEQVSSSTPVYLEGLTGEQTSSLPVYLQGTDTATGQQPAFLHGQAYAPAPAIININHETGDLSQYTSTVTDSGDLSVAEAAALAGTGYGLSCVIDDQNVIYGTKSGLNNTSGHLRARFYLNIANLTMTAEDMFVIFRAANNADEALLRLDLYKGPTPYQLIAVRFDDSGATQATSAYTIAQANTHYIELYLQRATAPGANDGSLTLWVDGTLVQTLTAINNDTRFASLGRVQMGAYNGLEAGTSGTMYMDELVINDTGLPIGPYYYQHAFLKGSTDANSGLPAYLSGPESFTDHLPVYLSGRADSNSNTPCYLSGSADALSYVPAYLVAEVSDRSSIYAYVSGQSSDVSVRAAYTCGSDNAVEGIPAYLAGGIVLTGQQAAYLSGQSSELSAVPAYLYGEITSSTPVYLKGGGTPTGQQAAYLKGQADSRGILSLQPGPVDGKDQHISNQYANRDYGAQTYFYIGYYSTTGICRTLIQFNLDKIPITATIRSAILSIRVTQDFCTLETTYLAYRLKTNWIEGTHTDSISPPNWSYRTLTEEWTSGGAFDPNDCEQTDSGSAIVAANLTPGSLLDFTLDPTKVQEWVSGAFANNGFLLKSQRESGDYSLYGFSSSDNATDNNRPKFEVIWEVPGSRQSAYLCGVLSATSTKNAYLVGQDQAFSVQNAYLEGGTGAAKSAQAAFMPVVSGEASSQNAYLVGQDLAFSSQNAYFAGQSEAQDSQQVYAHGTQSAVSSSPAILHGSLSDLSWASSYTRGQDFVSDNQSAYLKGEDHATTNAAGYTQGQETISGSLPVYVQGQDFSWASLPGYLHGLVENFATAVAAYLSGIAPQGSSSTSAYLTGTAEAIGVVHAFASGSSAVNHQQPAYLNGQADAISFTPAYTSGQATSTSGTPAFTIGQTLSSQFAYLYGQVLVISNAPAFLAGLSTATDARPSYLGGQEHANSATAAYTKGQETIQSECSAFTAGQDHAKAAQAAWGAGQVQGTSSQTSYLVGEATGTSYVHAYMRCGNLVTSAQPVYTLGLGTEIKGSIHAYIFSGKVPDDFLQGSADIQTDLEGSLDLQVNLQGSTDLQTNLEGSLDIVYNLDGDCSKLYTLEGSA